MIRVWKHLLRVTALSGLSLVSANAQESNWGKWGSADQLGTLNYITPEVTVQAAQLVAAGRIYSLAIPLAADEPAPSRRIQHFVLSGIGSHDSRPHWVNDFLSLDTQGTTHWDGLGHVFGEGKLYNGFDARTELTSAGALKNGVHLASNRIVTRGVLLDVARYKKAKSLAPGYVVTAADLAETAREQEVTLQPGDVILIRTGWMSRFYGEGAEDFWTFDWMEGQVRKEPGIGWEVTQWLRQVKAAAVAVDNMSAEAVPADPRAAREIGHPEFDRPVHYELIRNQGMMLGELFWLEELADSCEQDGRYEFLFVAPPYRLTRATGSPVNPIAIR